MTTPTQRIAVPTAGLGLIAPILLLTQTATGLHPVAATAVLLVLPGCAAVCWLRLTDRFAAAVVAVATSVAVTIVVSSALLYLGIWTWQRGVCVVSALTVLAAAASLLRDRPS